MSLYYYDELIEYRISSNGRNAKIINKIQGITYHLASKDRLYDLCNDKEYMPESIVFNIDTDSEEYLKKYIDSLRKNNTNRFIIKPVYGSQGKGIVIMSNNSINIFLTNMKQIKKQLGYSIFIISVYIDNPKLYNDIQKSKYNIKFNLRFYALLHINKLACYEKNENDINYYILKDVQIYFSVLPYDINLCDIPLALMEILDLNNSDKYIKYYDKMKRLTLGDISNLINLTNLQMVKNLSTFLDTDISLNNFIMSLKEMNYDEELKNNIIKQGEHIIHSTINSIKYNLRNINRFVPDSTAFNLIAYDTMLDDNDELHLIEINRGPDLHGLKLTLGENKITDIFGEIFDIVIDGKTESKLTHFSKYKLQYD